MNKQILPIQKETRKYHDYLIEVINEQLSDVQASPLYSKGLNFNMRLAKSYITKLEAEVKRMSIENDQLKEQIYFST